MLCFSQNQNQSMERLAFSCLFNVFMCVSLLAFAGKNHKPEASSFSIFVSLKVFDYNDEFLLVSFGLKETEKKSKTKTYLQKQILSSAFAFKTQNEPSFLFLFLVLTSNIVLRYYICRCGFHRSELW